MSKTIKLNISDDLREILERMSSRNLTAKQLLVDNEAHHLCEDYCDYIGISTDGNSISYLTKDRIATLPSDENPYSSSRRYEPKKPGSTITKIFKNISSKEIEQFVNTFKSEIDRKSKKLKIVSIPSRNIMKGYSNGIFKRNESGIVEGELGNNCMSREERHGFLKMYTEMSNVELLLLVEDNGEMYPEAYGRALLWTTNCGSKVIDRVYTIKREDYFDYFLDYGMKNGFYVRETGTHNASRTFYKDGEVVTKYFEVELPPKTELFPYMDTFKFFTANGKSLTNNDSNNGKILITNDGRYKEERYKYELFSNELVNVDKLGKDLHKLDYMENTYVYRSEMVKSTILNRLIHRNHAVFNEEINDYIFIDDSLNDQKLIQSKLEYKKSISSEAEKLKEHLRSLGVI